MSLLQQVQDMFVAKPKESSLPQRTLSNLVLESLLVGLSTGASFFALKVLWEEQRLYSVHRALQFLRNTARRLWKETPLYFYLLPLWTAHHGVGVFFCLSFLGLGAVSSNESKQQQAKPRSSGELIEALDGISSSDAEKDDRYLEMLVYNISHTDMVLGLNAPPTNQPDDEEDTFCLCRPRFSWFDSYSRRVLDNLTGDLDPVVQFPRYQRSVESPRYSINEMPSGGSVPIGFQLQSNPALEVDLKDLRVRGKDQCKLVDGQHYEISHVLFPLLASTFPKWLQMVHEKQYQRPIKKVLVLVTGVGTPRNWTHSVTGNSTQYCADLVEQFIYRLHPDVTVVKVHSETNIFRYDENLVFAERELMPVVNAYRDAHATGMPYPDEPQLLSSTARRFNEDWRKSFSVTLSFADGSPARTYAIQASMRTYRPTYFHAWQLKTFWHESKIVDDDIEVHSFEAMETVPAVDVERLTEDDIKAVVDEMKKFRDHMQEVVRGSHDLKRFWLRKTQKPVLAVLLVKSAGDEGGRLYRGTNMEVSMPTGSLCAERNVIGSALAENPGLRREDLKCVGVLAFPMPKNDERRLPHVTSTNSIGSVDAGTPARKPSIGSEADEWILQAAPASTNLDSSFHVIGQSLPSETVEVSSTPLRKVSLVSRSHRKVNKTVVVGTDDINPLKPCGACNEWLKKIAQSNPYFRIITFTDSECSGVYCNFCED